AASLGLDHPQLSRRHQIGIAPMTVQRFTRALALAGGIANFGFILGCPEGGASQQPPVKTRPDPENVATPPTSLATTQAQTPPAAGPEQKLNRELSAIMGMIRSRQTGPARVRLHDYLQQ